MASKIAIANGGERPERRRNASLERVVDTYKEFTRFLGDVRAEMRKVVTPSRKETEATTAVVLIAVFIFGVYFFVVDRIFDFGLHALLARLGGIQR
jgi:preprotein translocase subunit SecE